MSVFTKKSTVIITCHKRVSGYLAQEVTDLGFIIEETFVTGVRLFATINDCIKLNLNLRCASQVLYSIKQFEAEHTDAIYRHLLNFAWEDILAYAAGCIIVLWWETRFNKRQKITHPDRSNSHHY